jgi:hypothetical protein
MHTQWRILVADGMKWRKWIEDWGKMQQPVAVTQLFMHFIFIIIIIYFNSSRSHSLTHSLADVVLRSIFTFLEEFDCIRSFGNSFSLLMLFSFIYFSFFFCESFFLCNKMYQMMMHVWLNIGYMQCKNARFQLCLFLRSLFCAD